MNYHEAENMVLKLIDRYSVAGTPMALSYNNQADFVAKIPALLDDETPQQLLMSAFRKYRR